MFVVYFISILFLFALSPRIVLAETSLYRSAGWVATDERFINHYTNLSGCQASDGMYCSVQMPSGGINLYFSSFGTLNDFGIPKESKITKIHLKVKGKNDDIQRIYLDRGRNKKPLSQLCQYPFDLWPLYLGPTDTTREFHTLFTPYLPGNNLGNCFTPEIIDAQNYTFSIYDVQSYSWSSDIDNFEIAFDYTPPTPTNTPTPTPTAPPAGGPTPEPFLDLPWDYEAKGLSFNDAALAINTFFDHEYPLLSSGLSEPENNTIVPYFGFPRKSTKDNVWYSSHDGYDYGTLAGVKDGDFILAAASGEARLTLEKNSAGGGNVIKINHGNGYQTIYEHLYYDENLVVKSEGEETEVKQGDKIGRVGHTGNCWIQDKNNNKISNTPACAHIHFSVVEDKNKDGNFDDNIPDGLTDPFGWQSADTDPWENYSFFYNGQQRTGNKSYYLWKRKIDGLQASLPANGGIFQVGRATITFPHDNTRSDLSLEIHSSPLVQVSSSFSSLGSAISIVAKNFLGDVVKFLATPMTITIDFSAMDLSRFDLGHTTFAIYSSDDGEQWTKEPTDIDFSTKRATTKVNHLTYFALMADNTDTVAPTTSTDLQGSGQKQWFRSDVTVLLHATDNSGGLGVENIFSKKDEEDWQIYTAPLSFTTQGRHTISYYAVDKAGNSENPKTIEFFIDKTPPEAIIMYDLTQFDVLITGTDSAGTTIGNNNRSVLHSQYRISDPAGNTLTLNTDKIKIGKQVSLSIKNLTYNTNPLIPLENNIFFNLVVTDKQNKVKQLDQYYSLKDDKKIFSNFFASSNTTKFFTKTSGQTKYVSESKQGLILLKLYTQNGTLKYSY